MPKDPFDALSQLNAAIREVKASGDADARREMRETFDTFKSISRSFWSRCLTVLGHFALVGIGIAATLLQEYVGREESTDTHDWVVLIIIGVPSVTFFALYLYDEYF